MSLRVFCGPFSPALEQAFLERLAELAPGPARAVAVVAPSRRLADRLERLIALESGRALLNVRFHTFHSLALEALEPLGGPSRRVAADGLFHDLVLDRLLADAGARPSRGLAAAYRSSLRDLIDGGVDPASFREHLQGLLPEGEPRRKLEALVALQDRYLRRLDELGVLPPSGAAREAADAVASGRSRRLEAYAELLYYGFYDLTGAQADFFQAVAGAYACSLFFPYRKGHPAYEFAERFFRVRLGGAPVVHLDPGTERGALGPALDALFVPGAVVAPEDGALRVFSASGSRDEAWIVAKEILALRERADPPAFGDIGVVARTLEPYRSAIAEVFRENAIPFWTSSAGPLLRHPVAKRALVLLTLKRREFPARAVLDLIHAPGFKSDGRMIGDWTLLIRRLGIHSGWIQWTGRLSPWTRKDLPLSAAEDGPAIPAAHAAALLRWLEALHRALSGPPATGPDPWPAMAAHARRLLEDAFAAPSDPAEREAWDAVLDAIQALAGFGPAAPEAGFTEFLDALEEKLRRAELPAPPPNQGVRVLDAMDARGESFRHLFLIGLQEGVFPRQVREEPLLPDEARARLQHPGGYWIAPKLDGYAEERLLFALLASSASETVSAVYPRSNEEGRAQVPSLYLRELCRAAGIELGSAARVPRRPFEKLGSVPPERLAPKELALLWARSAAASSGWLEPAGLDHRLFDACRRRLPELDRGGEPGSLDGVLGELEGAAAARPLTPTALETFVRCPFQFFASRLLGLGEALDPAERGALDPRARGQLAHAALERFHRSLAAAGYGAAWEPHLERALAEVLGALSWRELGLFPLVWEAARRRLSDQLRRLAALDVARIRATGMAPAHFEREVAAVLAGAPFQGRIDRADVGADGSVWIVDYKSGRGPADLADAVRGMDSLQPPLYLELALASGLGEGRAAGAALYCLDGTREEPGEPALVTLEAEEWKALRRGFLENLADHAGRMRRGEFFIVRDEEFGGACTWCSFPAVCRKAHAPTWRRTRGSEMMAAFEKARRIA